MIYAMDVNGVMVIIYEANQYEMTERPTEYRMLDLCCFVPNSTSIPETSKARWDLPVRKSFLVLVQS